MLVRFPAAEIPRQEDAFCTVLTVDEGHIEPKLVHKPPRLFVVHRFRPAHIERACAQLLELRLH